MLEPIIQTTVSASFSGSTIQTISASASLSGSTIPASSTEDECEKIPVRKVFIDVEKFKESGVITPEDFAQIIQRHADEENVNWGEIDDVLGLYALADSASKDTGGIPDSILKEAMYFVLSLQAKTLPNGWLRNHVLKLQRLWKDETEKERATKRKTMVPMEAKPIHPFHDLKRKRKRATPAVAQSLMGISSLLSHARTCMVLEDGDHEVVERNDGNIEVDGEMLTFDSWGKLSGSNDSIISYENKDQFENKVMPTPNIITLESAPVKTKRFKKDKPEDSPSAAQIKRRRTVSEEGEISSDSENSSSSSDDDSDLEADNNESKRSAKRRQRRQNVKNNHYEMKRRMQDIYNQRFDVVNYLSTEQKVELLRSLRMVYGEKDESMKAKEALSKFLSQP
uniref:Uncharacterized protein n=1 Tax=Panagrolaimus sp. ES5 TaxID=591445 RepID=A0AC34FUM6_9BILA